MQKQILPSLLLWWASIIAMQAAAPEMRSYSIDLPHHVLRFSLPDEIANEMTPLQVEKRFDPNERGVAEKGFRQIAGHLHDFKGPFWAGAYGSLKFHFMIQKRAADYQGDITTADGLDRYVHWWIGNDTSKFVLSHATLNGAAATRREHNTFGDRDKAEPEDLEIFSLVLDQDFFLDVGFNVMEWEGGRDKEGKWKVKAEALREAIKDTVLLEPQPNNRN